MYNFIKDDLQVPLLHSNVLQYPEVGMQEYLRPVPFMKENIAGEDAINKDHLFPTTGSFITRIYRVIRSGALLQPAIECLREVERETHPLHT